MSDPYRESVEAYDPSVVKFCLINIQTGSIQLFTKPQSDLSFTHTIVDWEQIRVAVFQGRSILFPEFILKFDAYDLELEEGERPSLTEYTQRMELKVLAAIDQHLDDLVLGIPGGSGWHRLGYRLQSSEKEAQTAKEIFEMAVESVNRLDPDLVQPDVTLARQEKLLQLSSEVLSAIDSHPHPKQTLVRQWVVAMTTELQLAMARRERERNAKDYIKDLFAEKL